MMRVVATLAVLLSSPAIAGELELNEVEQRLGIPYVQDRVVLDVHGPAPMFGNWDRSYRHPDYTEEWKRDYCYLTYWRNELNAMFERAEIPRKTFKTISKALYRDQRDVVSENKEAYEKAVTTQVNFLHHLRVTLKKDGLSACDG